MAVQKRREEAEAAGSKYVDRAAERRKEENRQQREGGGDASAAAAQAFYDANAYNPVAQWAEAPPPPEATVSDAPTFAKAGTRDALGQQQQQHHASIAQSKYLGGDVEHTHLVKGLDFALLNKVRAEQQAADAAKAKKEEEAAAKQAVARRAQLLPTKKGKASASFIPSKVSTGAKKADPTLGRQAAGGGGGGGGSSIGGGGGSGGAAPYAPPPQASWLKDTSDFARDIHRAIYGERQRPTRRSPRVGSCFAMTWGSIR